MLSGFLSILESKKFTEDLIKCRKLVNNLHTIDTLRDKFAWFLVAYPLNGSKEKIFIKLSGKRKFGLLSRHLMSVSKRLGMDNLTLNRFHELKDDEKYYLDNIKNKSWNSYFNGEKIPNETIDDRYKLKYLEDIAIAKWNIHSSLLFNFTNDLLDFCLSKYNAREDKINQLLENE